jgi:hypothetical protein
MPPQLGESDTRAKLIDPAIHTRGRTEDLICREETAGTIEIIAGQARKRRKGRVDYTLRVQVNPGTQPIAVAGQFTTSGTEGLENRQIFRMPDVTRAGGLNALRTVGNPADLLRQTKLRMFAA